MEYLLYKSDGCHKIVNAFTHKLRSYHLITYLPNMPLENFSAFRTGAETFSFLTENFSMLTDKTVHFGD